MRIKINNSNKSFNLHLIYTFLLLKCFNLIIWDFQNLLSTEAAIIPSNNIQRENNDLRENNPENQPIVERIEIRLIDNIENSSNEKQLMIVDVVKKQGSEVAATIQQQNEFMDKQMNKPWFLVRIRQPYYHSTIYESFDQINDTKNEIEINNNLINKMVENEEILNNNLLKNDSKESSKEEEKDYLLEDEGNKTINFDDKEECLLNKENLERTIIQRLIDERRRIVRTIKKINRQQKQLCRMDRRKKQEKVLYRKCPMWRREKFFLYYALMRITYCGNHERWPGGIYYNEY
ncbi:hypothetical protein ACQ4LE_009910 [Meloidogyne hapla]|uniref:Uncharacterized protein n=1 Tax=Meloidogyne hapla TaxID=6305 RepID=A0A1I8B2H3_MELHA